MNGLIGYTGFVGSNILDQHSFDALYRSTNIEEVKGKDFDLLVCSGAPAAKWIANQQPETDLANLKGLMSALGEAKAERFVLISTVDVYKNVLHVDEDTVIDPHINDAYGKNRFFLEEFVREKFPHAVIVRLPGLFGKGLKKNFVFDLIHSNALDWTHKDSRFQMYDLSRLWSDISIALEKELPLVNFATAPVLAEDIARECFNIEFTNMPDKVPANYDMWTKYASDFGGEGHYLYGIDEGYERIRQYLKQEHNL
jgi:hypothetical protein